MVEIFLVQLLAAALGAGSTAIADWLYRSDRIGQRLHSFWVSASIAVICLPVIDWTCNVFLGFGLPTQLVVAVLLGLIFSWVYRSLRRLPAAPSLGPQLPPQRPSSDAVPPASKLNS
jgi:hypothetical protein